MAKTNWEELYTDLSTRTANSLREARVQPEQLIKMSDGEITSIAGIGDVGLEEIRAKYPADISQEEPEKQPVKEEAKEEEEAPMPANKRHLFRNSTRIKKARMDVDRTKLYELDEAVELVKKTNIARFNATVTLHLNLKEKTSKIELSFPYSTGASKKVVIATDETLKKIDKGDIDFDVLIATPAMMGKITKYARVLGPKGLMPNPKTGTITDNPEDRKKELEGGKTIISAEPKAPLMHVVVGKVEQPQEELTANIRTVIEAVKPGNISKATLASTMSPGVKIKIQ